MMRHAPNNNNLDQSTILIATHKVGQRFQLVFYSSLFFGQSSYSTIVSEE